MVESSKILTVSYGTFSCTLEGFDDSFGTMKAIAEYFRDLAQGDRYFGAEPPAPDAEMLTRIAEKEIARRVEARADESGIVLRATDADQAPAMPPVATPPSIEEVAAAAPVVEEEIVEDAPAATADAEADVAEPEVGEDVSPTLVTSSPAAEDEADTEMDVAAPPASFADMEASKAAEVPAHPDADSVAAKLQRIRAVVGPDTSDKDDHALEGDLTEELNADSVQEDVAEIAENASEQTDNVFAEIAEDTTETEDVWATEPNQAADDQDDLEVAEVVETADAEDKVEEAAEAETTEEAAVVEDTPKQNFRARILRVAKKPAVAEIADETAANTAASVRESIAAQMGEDAIAEAEPVADDVAQADVVEETAVDPAPTGTLSEADEAELMADLAEVERETEVEVEAEAAIEMEVASEEEVETEVEEAAEIEPIAEAGEPTTPSGRDILPEADDAAMSRIMDEADEQLSEPAGSRRRSAIAQLKAAVAATEAARQLGDNGNDAAAKETAFRDDLNEAVRPRSASDLPRTQERTERPRPAPLKLVEAQRVDEEDAATPQEPTVQPRRVAADNAANSDAGSFADFASDMGATELPDLLEAAAAYTAYVEGIEDFSRPQIMKKVQASASEEFSREDGLRSFGTLLRQGRISKVRNGRFQVSDQTRFKPEKKAG